MPEAGGENETGWGSDALLRAALDSMPYGFSVWDDDQRLVLHNQLYLDLYRFPPERVSPGMTLLDTCRLTVELENHPGTSAEELYALYKRRLDETTAPNAVLKSPKAIRGRVIRTTHSRVVGLGWIVMHEDVTDQTEQQWLAELREKTLTTQNNRFVAALASMSHGLSLYDAEWRLVTCNQRYRDMYGLSQADTRPGTALDHIITQRRQTGATPLVDAAEFTAHVVSTSDPSRRTVQTYRLSNGRVLQVTQSPVEGGGYVAIHQDITEDIARLESLEANRAEIAVQKMRFEAAINNMSQGLCMFDAAERLVVCNARYAELYGLPAAMVTPGTSLTDILEHRFQRGMVPRQGREAYVAGRRRLIADGVDATDEFDMEDGRVIAVQHHPTADGGWVATHEDVTEQRRIEAQVRHLARHDALTDLPNRVFLREETTRLEARLQRGEIVAVLCLDLDHFKTVNDTLGHGIGDQLLVTMAERLRKAARETDVVARLGGDEFAIVAHDLETPRDAALIADRIVRAAALPMELDGHQVSIGASVGIAVAPSDGMDAETLLKKADMALYRAKNEGRGAYHFFETGMDEALQLRRLLEQGLRTALARGEFRLMYQPLLDLAHNRVGCVEALLRWEHPERGTISPSEFIPIAEETGAIGAIGAWVLNEACRAAAGWPEHVRIAVNLSPAQFKISGLVPQVVGALGAAGLAATRLELEVTESLLLADTESMVHTLHEMRALGVRISMDDFGTGYSSLSSLRSFPFDKIKIDRSFMQDLGAGSSTLAIIRAVIGLARNLGMSTTAEGIETEEQLAAVRAQGCDEVQGFLFSPPLPASGIDALLGHTKASPERRKAG